MLDPAAANPFHGYPNTAYFWDTVCYTGLLPWLAVVLLLCFVPRPKLEIREINTFWFALILGVAGIVLSLPIVHQAMSLIPGTIFRSPSRLIYLTEFALAMALGIGMHWVMVVTRQRFARVVVPLLLTVHIVDLAGHDRQFILRQALPPAAELEVFTKIFDNMDDGRAAIDYGLMLPVNRTVDDVGFFDSVMLARPYHAILSLVDAPQNLNIQTFNGSELSSRALAALGVRVMITAAKRDDLRNEGQIRGIRIYKIPSPSPRAEFFDASQVQFLPSDQIHAMLRDPAIDLRSALLLPQEPNADRPKAVGESVDEQPKVEYRRPDSDHIEVTVTTGRSGYLRIIESWDPGWSAAIDGLPVPIVPALNALLAVPLPPGHHEIRFVYRAPGVAIGQAISITSLALLFVVIWRSGKRRS